SAPMTTLDSSCCPPRQRGDHHTPGKDHTGVRVVPYLALEQHPRYEAAPSLWLSSFISTPGGVSRMEIEEITLCRSKAWESSYPHLRHDHPGNRRARELSPVAVGNSAGRAANAW